jgi:V-type H+-transporting ATPase subunit H
VHSFILPTLTLWITNSNLYQTTVCIALYDIGEFCRFYPNGRVVVSRLGGKDAVMKLLNHNDAEVQQQTLKCISKIMVNNWEHLR